MDKFILSWWVSEILPDNQDKVGGSIRLSVLDHVALVQRSITAVVLIVMLSKLQLFMIKLLCMWYDIYGNVKD